MAVGGRGRVIAHHASVSFCSPQIKLTMPIINKPLESPLCAWGRRRIFAASISAAGSEAVSVRLSAPATLFTHSALRLLETEPSDVGRHY
jgi:hypothetical protein